MATSRPLLLVFGATGYTGKSIVKGLLESGDFRVVAAVRPASLSKPAVEELRESGIEVRVADIGDDVQLLKKAFEGVSVIIAAVNVPGIPHQKNAILAAKEAGVQRFVPCDFGTPGAKGVRELFDAKLEIREFIKEVGLPYTFIDIGWWMQLYLPLPLHSKAADQIKQLTWTLVESGEARTLLTDRERIGIYVARVVADPRTLNQAVIVWEDQASQREAHELGERLSGEGDKLKAKRIYVTGEDLLNTVAAAKAERANDPANFKGGIRISWNLYNYSMFVLRENTLENAKKLGYLDARELYPHIVPLTFAEYAQRFYGLEDPVSDMYYF